MDTNTENEIKKALDTLKHFHKISTDEEFIEILKDKANIVDMKKAVMDWYELCYEPELTEKPQAVHWATKKLADCARELKK